MKLLITLMSTLLLIIQVPIKAEVEGDNLKPSIDDSQTDIQSLLSNYTDALNEKNIKVILSDKHTHQMLLGANNLLDSYMSTDDTDLKQIIIDKLLSTQTVNYFTFLHYAAQYGQTDILVKTINTFKENPIVLNDLMLKKGSYRSTFLHKAASNVDSDIVAITLAELNERPELVKNLLMAKNLEDQTFLHLHALDGNGEIISESLKSLKQHPDLLKDLLLVEDNDGDTFLDIMSCYQGINHIKNIQTLLNVDHGDQFINNTQLFTLKNNISYNIISLLCKAGRFSIDMVSYLDEQLTLYLLNN